MPSRAQLERFARRVENMLKHGDRLTARAIQQLLREFDDLHRDIEQLLQGRTLTPDQVRILERELSQLGSRYAERIQDLMLRSQTEAWRAGAEIVPQLLITVGLQVSDQAAAFIIRPDPVVVESLSRLTFSRIVQVTEQMRAGIIGEVVRAMVLGQSSFQAMQNITHILGIRSLRGFREVGATGISAKAEAIFRTEMMTALNMASDQAMEKAVDVLGDEAPSFKVWMATGDARTRLTHLEAHGQKVPLNGKFTVGGWPAKHPHDPALPPQERINCRCRHVVWSDAWGDMAQVFGGLNEQVANQIAERKEKSGSRRSAAGRRALAGLNRRVSRVGG